MTFTEYIKHLLDHPPKIIFVPNTDIMTDFETLREIKNWDYYILEDEHLKDYWDI